VKAWRDANAGSRSRHRAEHSVRGTHSTPRGLWRARCVCGARRVRAATRESPPVATPARRPVSASLDSSGSERPSPPDCRSRRLKLSSLTRETPEGARSPDNDGTDRHWQTAWAWGGVGRVRAPPSRCRRATAPPSGSPRHRVRAGRVMTPTGDSGSCWLEAFDRSASLRTSYDVLNLG
jgi:hypothetical protein